MSTAKIGEKLMAGGVLLLACLWLVAEVARPFADMSFRPLQIMLPAMMLIAAGLWLRALLRT